MEDIVALVYEAQNDTRKLNTLIEQFLPFIKKCVAKERLTKQSQDDALTLAMLALADSIKTYRSEKGNFISYAQASIRNRLIDDYRSEQKHSAASVPLFHAHDEESFALENKLSIDAYRLQMEREALRLEIQETVQNLKAWNTSLGELSLICPKQRRTRAKCDYIAALILKNDKWRNELLIKKRMLKSDIRRVYSVSDKLLEKYRKYIAVICLVQSGDYPILRAFLPITGKGDLENE